MPRALAGNVYSSSLSREHYALHQQSTPDVLDVQVVTLDGFAARAGLANVDLVKIDAEGHDLQVLEGMMEILRRDVPTFLIEIQSDDAGAAMMRPLDPVRYSYFNLSETIGPRRAAALGRSNTVNFFVCRHETARRLALPD